MAQKIHIQDLSQPKYKLFIGIGIAMLVIAFVTWALEMKPIIYYVSSIVAIASFFYISSDTFTRSNTLSFDKKGATFKLMGNKTYGFRFVEMTSVHLTDRGLHIELMEQEDVKLSRKRYQEQSLNTIYQILKQKNNNYE